MKLKNKWWVYSVTMVTVYVGMREMLVLFMIPFKESLCEIVIFRMF